MPTSSLPEQAVNDQWSQPGGNPYKTMGHLALSDAPRQAWSVSIEGSTPKARLASAPVVADGKLYVIDASARVIAMELARVGSEAGPELALIARLDRKSVV